MSGFERLGVSPTILSALRSMGYETPTPVQEKAIPILLLGRDAIIEAETGSGKTAAYGVPAVEQGSRSRGMRVIVLVPTRELARQVAEEVREIGTGSDFRCVALTGGISEEAEERAMTGDVRCVIATPGRLLALFESGKLRPNAINLVILDEADRMLDMGFRGDVEKILEITQRRSQTVLLSATLPTPVIRLAEEHLSDPVDVRVGSTSIPASLEHHRINVMVGEKEPAICALLKKEDPERAMVFVRTRNRATAFTKLLKQAGIAADALQGNMTHDQRRHVFDLFSRGITRVLVATDIASRGLDVPEMELVVNIDLPDEDETYLHRAGRSARMGRAGRVITFVLPEEKARRLHLEEVAGLPFTPYRLAFSEADIPLPPVKPAPKKGPRIRGPKPGKVESGASERPSRRLAESGPKRTTRATRTPGSAPAGRRTSDAAPPRRTSDGAAPRRANDGPAGGRPKKTDEASFGGRPAAGGRPATGDRPSASRVGPKGGHVKRGPAGRAPDRRGPAKRGGKGGGFGKGAKSKGSRAKRR